MVGNDEHAHGHAANASGSECPNTMASDRWHRITNVFDMSNMHCAESWSIHIHSLPFQLPFFNHLECLSCMQLTKSCSFQWFFISKTFKLNAIRLHLAFAWCHQGSANWFAITLSLWRTKKSWALFRRNKTCFKKGFVFISKPISIILLQEPDKLINDKCRYTPNQI